MNIKVIEYNGLSNQVNSVTMTKWEMKHVLPPRKEILRIKSVVCKDYNVRMRATVPNRDTVENRYELLKKW